MGMYSDDAQETLYRWFQKAADWQKDLFCAMWNGANNESSIVERVINLIDQDYLLQNNQLVSNITFPKDIDFADAKVSPIILKHISDIQGVGALSAKSPLEFDSGLTVVYGENGCGKSSYVRILKAAENPEYAGKVIGNIFSSENNSASATITFSSDGDEQPLHWDKANQNKYPILIYDTDIAHQFVDKDNEVVYEPKVLSIISRIANVFAQVSTHYQKVSDDLLKKYSQIPEDIINHPIVQAFKQLTTSHDTSEFEKRAIWDDSTEAELSSIVGGLQVSEPEKVAQSLEAKKKVVQDQWSNILSLRALVCDESCEDYLRKRQKQIDTKKVADELICAAGNQSALVGFGCDSWRTMWADAVNYIIATEQISVEVPVSKDGRCALCQQMLDADAQSRLQSFNKFALSQAITDAEIAFRNFEHSVRELQEKIENSVKISVIETALRSSSISEDISSLILNLYHSILTRNKWLLDYESGAENPPSINSSDEVATKFKPIITEMETQIKTLLETALDRQKQIERKNRLLALKWACDNMLIKKQEILLLNIQGKCKTNSITTLKKDLSDILITEAYVARFSSEMLKLDPSSRIKVELVSKSAKGRAYHQVSLRGVQILSKMKAGEVLSEGEYRVVSLAAFLADLSSWGGLMPFIFDDPITSLDHKFEERIAQRLIQLSTVRQVIVFTHRLSFAQFLDLNTKLYNADAAQTGQSSRAKIKHIELRTSPLGQPTEASYIENISLSKKLNNMINDDLNRIKKSQNNNDYPTADHIMRSLCTQFRNLVEGGIEHHLLSGVVLRFNRNISSLKLPRLYAISRDDVTIFDRLMTKYSAFDHSQSIETTISLPQIAEVEEDLKDLAAWVKDFETRCNIEVEKAKGKK